MTRKDAIYLFSLGLLVVAVIFLFINYLSLLARVEFARSQVEVFRFAVSASSEGDVATIREQIDYVASYYPTGTVQLRGSDLDCVVESCREGAMAELRFILASKQIRNGNASSE